MKPRFPHLTDEEILLAGEEGALAPARELAARRHLASCPRCADRAARLASTLDEALWACRAARDAETPRDARRGRRVAYGAHPWGVAAAGVAGLLVLAGTLVAGPGRAPGGSGEQAPLPRPELTPGSVRPITTEEVCGRGLTDAGTAPVAAPVPRQVFEAYGLDYRSADDYELDFLVTPELGGAAEAANLWPQPYDAGPWNARVKDELERHLVRLVCGGHLDLAAAQRELATDWVDAYKRHFHTEAPLRQHATAGDWTRQEDVNA